MLDEGKMTGVIDSKGEVIAGGASGLVELISPNLVVKSPWPEAWEYCCKDIRLEAEVYQMLGEHRCLVKFFGYDPLDGSITLEYMQYGTLRDYLQTHGEQISLAQRFEWALRAAEGLGVLHSASIYHCDFSPKNLLLDADLELKVADFACSSIQGSRSSGMGSVRFFLPRGSRSARPSTLTDLFSLGSTIYEIITGAAPYNDLASPQIQQLYQLSQFPDLVGVQLADVIRSCWLLQVQSAEEVHDRILSASRIHED